MAWMFEMSVSFLEVVEVVLSCRPTRFSIAMTAFAKLGHRPRGAQAQRLLTELDRRLDGADARVSSCHRVS